MRRLMTGLLGMSLLLAACGDDDADERAAVTSIPDDTTTSSTTTTEPDTVAPDVIPRDPSQITEDYVEQVLNELFEVSLEAALVVRDAGLVEETALELVRATTSDGVFEQDVNDLAAQARSKFEGLKKEPAPLVLSVVDLLEASPTCVVAEVTTDASGLLEDPPPPEPNERDFIRILQATEEQRRSGLNPTAWVLDQFPVTYDGSIPELTCVEP